jgi:hypothetical protein
VPPLVRDGGCGSRRGRALAGLGLLLLLSWLFRDALAGGVFYKRDIHLVWHPQVEAFVRSVVAGELPLWDPSPAFGQPLLADPGAMILYPLTWLNLVLKPWTYYTVFALAHFALAGVGVFALARRLGLSLQAASLAATVFVCSGPWTSLTDLWHHFAGAAWMPLVLLLADRAASPGRVRDVLLLGLGFAAQIVAGSADMCAMSGLAAVGLVAARHLRRCERAVAEALGAARRGLLGVLVALGVAAAAWAPALQAVSRSARSALPDAVRSYWSVHPLGLLDLLYPAPINVLPLSAAWRQVLFEGREPFLLSIYLGLPTLTLVGAAAISHDRRTRWFLFALLGATLAISLGRHAPFHAVAEAVLPPLRVLRYPMKALVPAALAWSLLAGLGLDVWRAPGLPERRRWLAFAVGPLALAAAAGLSLTAWAALRPQSFAFLLSDIAATGDALPRALAPSTMRVAIASGLGAVALVLALIRLRSRLGWATAAIAVLAAGELAAYHNRPNPTAPLALYTHRPAIVGALDPQASRVYVYDYTAGDRARRYLGRAFAHTLRRAPVGWSLDGASALAMQQSLAPQTAGRWGLRQAFDIDYRGLHPTPLARLAGLLRTVEGTPAHRTLLQLGGVTHVIALHTAGLEDLTPLGAFDGLLEEPVRLFSVPDPLPRAYVVGGALGLDAEAALAVVVDPGFDPRREVILESGTSHPSAAGFAGKASIVRESPGHLTISVEASHPGWLVLVDGFDPGWASFVDGARVPTLRANVAFRAVAVGAGRHEVEMRYRPAAACVGGIASVLTLTIVGAVWFRTCSK